MTQPHPNPALAGVARVSIASTMLGQHIYEAACLMKQEPASWGTLTMKQRIAFRRQALTILKELR
jgi:hypothetical protein